MSETELLGLSLLLATIIGLIVWGIVKHTKKDKERNRFLAKVGFTPCEEETNALSEKISLIENNSEYAYSVKASMKLQHGGVDVYFFTKERRRHGDIYVAHEFLFPVNRKTNVPFQAYLKPGSIKGETATKLLRNSVTTGWDTQSDDLIELELPRELHNSNILGLMAPSDCRFYDLFDSAAISLLGQAGDHDIFTIRCRGNLCSIENPLTGHGWNYNKVWPFVRTIIGQGL